MAQTTANIVASLCSNKSNMNTNPSEAIVVTDEETPIQEIHDPVQHIYSGSEGPLAAASGSAQDRWKTRALR